ncbi:hypothetical protein B0A50_01667 [Salinomyces thailandicus]|uniref:Uncharacterized protein n=1 Tax=Salinomyces thailandicus TaxID=706561 RepID=A0A4V5N855_9PEZI|nr:hypothetical protein B0A50_01667 [Salinomyces thailandica]
MSNALQSFLRLPGCIRRQTLDALPQRTPVLRPDFTGSATRQAFSNSSHVFGQARRTKRPPPIPTSISQGPPPPGRNLPTGRNAPPTTALSPLPKLTSYAESLLKDGREVLLYKGPSHRAFTGTAIICGGLLVYGAWNTALLPSLLEARESDETKKSGGAMNWITTSVVLLSAVGLAGLGTTLILAPVRMIKSVSARAFSDSKGNAIARLKCEMTNPMPFMKRRFIEVSPSEALLDRQVSATDIDFTSVPLSAAEAFTASPKPFAEALTKPKRNPVARAYDALRRDVRRMFYRDGFAYIRFPENGGNWKLDLQNCELLDNGIAIEKLTTPDPKKGVGAVALLWRKYMI